MARDTVIIVYYVLVAMVCLMLVVISCHSIILPSRFVESNQQLDQLSWEIPKLSSIVVSPETTTTTTTTQPYVKSQLVDEGDYGDELGGATNNRHQEQNMVLQKTRIVPDYSEIASSTTSKATASKRYSSQSSQTALTTLISKNPCIVVRMLHEYDCKGSQLSDIPKNLRDPYPTKLTLTEISIKIIRQNAVRVYRRTLVELIFMTALELEAIEPGAFNGLPLFKVIRIFGAPKLISLDGVFSGNHPNLKVIQIRNTNIRSFPKFDKLKMPQGKFMEIIDLQNNNISTLGDQPLKLTCVNLQLSNNAITELPNSIFEGSEIGLLNLSSNKNLKYIHEHAFKGSINMDTFILSDTKIERLPTEGLATLTKLVIEDTKSLKTIPTIYQFPQLNEAAMTYPYHCCAFHNPAQHDPKAHEEHKQKQAEIDANCKKHSEVVIPASEEYVTLQSENSSTTSPMIIDEDDTIVSLSRSMRSSEPFTTAASRAAVSPEPEIRVVSCGVIANRFKDHPNSIKCTPVPDTLNPCEDIMGNSVLRHLIWLVILPSLMGNLAVILVLGSVFSRLTVPRFLQLNLALGDLFTGVYLLMLATADRLSEGTYFNYAIAWQQGLGCKVAGSANLFASQLSIFTLSVITFERFFTITNTIDLNMRLKLSWASRIMVLGWLYSIGSALLPILADISSYSVSSICLPLRANTKADLAFVASLIALKTVAFFILLACYLKMYLLIKAQQTEANFHERRVAKRMALLVLTDFFCYAPIIFFALTALLEKPLISMTNTKYLIVFFYPLNSVANPFLYVISTRQYKRDLDFLNRRFLNWCRNITTSQVHTYTAYGDPNLNLKQLRYPIIANNNNNINNNNNNLNNNGKQSKRTRKANKRLLAMQQLQQQQPQQELHRCHQANGGVITFEPGDTTAKQQSSRPIDHFRCDLIEAGSARRNKMLRRLERENNESSSARCHLHHHNFNTGNKRSNTNEQQNNNNKYNNNNDTLLTINNNNTSKLGSQQLASSLQMLELFTTTSCTANEIACNGGGEKMVTADSNQHEKHLKMATYNCSAGAPNQLAPPGTTAATHSKAPGARNSRRLSRAAALGATSTSHSSATKQNKSTTSAVDILGNLSTSEVVSKTDSSTNGMPVADYKQSSSLPKFVCNYTDDNNLHKHRCHHRHHEARLNLHQKAVLLKENDRKYHLATCCKHKLHQSSGHNSSNQDSRISLASSEPDNHQHRRHHHHHHHHHHGHHQHHNHHRRHHGQSAPTKTSLITPPTNSNTPPTATCSDPVQSSTNTTSIASEVKQSPDSKSRPVGIIRLIDMSNNTESSDQNSTKITFVRDDSNERQMNQAESNC